MSKEVYEDLIAYGAPVLPEGYKYRIESNNDKNFDPHTVDVRMSIVKEVIFGFEHRTPVKKWWNRRKTAPVGNAYSVKIIEESLDFVRLSTYEYFDQYGSVELQLANIAQKLYHKAFTTPPPISEEIIKFVGDHP